MWELIAVLCTMGSLETCQVFPDNEGRIFKDMRKCEQYAEYRFYDTMEEIRLRDLEGRMPKQYFFQVGCEKVNKKNTTDS